MARKKVKHDPCDYDFHEPDKKHDLFKIGFLVLCVPYVCKVVQCLENYVESSCSINQHIFDPKCEKPCKKKCEPDYVVKHIHEHIHIQSHYQKCHDPCKCHSDH